MLAHDSFFALAVRNAINKSTFLGPRGTRFLLKKPYFGPFALQLLGS